MVTTVATIVMATVAILGVIGAGIAWFYRRGRDEQALSSSVDKNTDATNLLAAQVGGLRDILETHTVTLTEHHFRLKALEDREVKVIVK